MERGKDTSAGGVELHTARARAPQGNPEAYKRQLLRIVDVIILQSILKRAGTSVTTYDRAIVWKQSDTPTYGMAYACRRPSADAFQGSPLPTHCLEPRSYLDVLVRDVQPP
jgi:hypothetical protein